MGSCFLMTTTVSGMAQVWVKDLMMKPTIGSGDCSLCINIVACFHFTNRLYDLIKCRFGNPRHSSLKASSIKYNSFSLWLTFYNCHLWISFCHACITLRTFKIIYLWLTFYKCHLWISFCHACITLRTFKISSSVGLEFQCIAA